VLAVQQMPALNYSRWFQDRLMSRAKAARTVMWRSGIKFIFTRQSEVCNGHQTEKAGGFVRNSRLGRERLCGELERRDWQFPAADAASIICEGTNGNETMNSMWVAVNGNIWFDGTYPGGTGSKDTGIAAPVAASPKHIIINGNGGVDTVTFWAGPACKYFCVRRAGNVIC
jgi:hypothetical protein